MTIEIYPEIYIFKKGLNKIICLLSPLFEYHNYSRFSKITTTLRAVLKEENCEFMHNDHLGWILTCPSNLGTGLRAGAMVQIPKFSARSDFKAVCKKMGLQIRGTKGNILERLIKL